MSHHRPAPDFYTIFGLTKSAGDREIRHSYRRLAMLYHPDKLSPMATLETRLQQEERFKHLHAVYEVLIDPTKRSIYDQYGIEALMNQPSSTRRSSSSSSPSSSSSSSSSASTSPSMSGQATPSSTTSAFASSFSTPRTTTSSGVNGGTGSWATPPPQSSSSYWGHNAAAASRDDNDVETTHTFHFSFGNTGGPAMGMHTKQSTIPTNGASAASSSSGFTLPPLDIGGDSNGHSSDSFGSVYGNGHINNGIGNNNNSYGTSTGTFTNYTNLPAGQASHMHMHLPQLTPSVAEKMLSSMLAAMGASPLPDLPTTSSSSSSYGAFEALDTSYAHNNSNSNGDGMDERADGLPSSDSSDMLTSYNPHAAAIAAATSHHLDRKHWPAAANVSPAAAAHWQSMVDQPMGRPSMTTHMGTNSRPTGPTKVFPLELSLEDLFMGGVKRMRVQRLRWDAHGVLRPEIKMLEIKIMPGWRGGTKITYEHEGDEHAHRAIMPSDIVFVVTEKRHTRFVRRGDHLCYTHELRDPNDALLFNIPTLDGRTLTIDCRHGPPVGPGSKHKVVGEGMPTKYLGGGASTTQMVVATRPHRGDLLIDFNVIFPADPLSAEQKRAFMTPVHS